VINLDKPSGPTSHEVASWVKRILRIGRVGHSGTLDPKVTGVLPIMLGDATKVMKALLLAPKEYVCLMRLNAETIRWAPQGQVVRRPLP
jgi:H/ACA ribonucleoprotein complex subunit 4